MRGERKATLESMPLEVVTLKPNCGSGNRRPWSKGHRYEPKKPFPESVAIMEEVIGKKKKKWLGE